MAIKPHYDFRLIIKCTRLCNFLCEYCFDRKNNADSDLSFTNLAKIFSELGQLEDTKRIQIIWHGGEPLLRGIKFFQKAIFLQDRLVPSHIKLTHVLQTNGSLITDEWASFFHENKFHIGISIDGPKEIHDLNRPLGTRKSSYDLTMRGIETLRKYQVRFGLLTVVNERILEYGPNKLWNYFKSNGFKSFGLLSLRRPYTNPAEEIKYNQKYGEFMSEVQRLWLKADDPSIQIREFQSKLDQFFGLPARLCKDGGNCVGKYFGIEPNGDVFHCDKFCSNKSWRIGHVSELSFQELPNSTNILSLQSVEMDVRSRCESCEWHSLCRGGCLSDNMALTSANGRVGTSDCTQYSIYSSISSFLAKSPKIIQAAILEIKERNEVF